MEEYFCWVCEQPIVDTDEEPHTYHVEGCPRRDPDPHADFVNNCAQFNGCGEDVHSNCCPTCTGQAF